MPHRALVVEDHAILSGALAAALEGQGFEVAVAPTDELHLDAVRSLAESWRPDVAVVDLYLGPERLGIPLIGPLAAGGSAVVVLTTSRDPILLGECVAAGAVAVVDKADPFDDLVATLTGAAEGRSARWAAHRAHLLAARDDALAARADQDSRFTRLSQRERQVLGLLVEGATAKQVAHRLGISVATVRTQIRAILEKLKVRSQREAVVEAVRAGWRSSGS